jgi:hypothetical protein
MPWSYEADETPKRKHHWDRPYAGFVDVCGQRVGKCPSDLSISAAEVALNAGVPWTPSRWRHAYPQRIYAVLDGVVYRATPTVPGVSYHGFPERPEEITNDGRFKGVLTQLTQHAQRDGCLEEFNYWMKHGSDRRENPE